MFRFPSLIIHAAEENSNGKNLKSDYFLGTLNNAVPLVKITRVKPSGLGILTAQKEIMEVMIMKKLCLWIPALLLVAAVCGGCRGRGSVPETTPPSTNTGTSAPTSEPTRGTTPPSSLETEDTTPTVDNGNGPLDGTGETGGSNGEGSGNNGTNGGSTGESTDGNARGRSGIGGTGGAANGNGGNGIGSAGGNSGMGTGIG